MTYVSKELIKRMLPGIVTACACAFLSGCATEKLREAPPLYAAVPPVDAMPSQELLPMPARPDTNPVQLKLVLPRTDPQIGPENSVMRRGAEIKENSSVVISVPSWLSGANGEKEVHPAEYSQNVFSTADNFHILEQFVEKGLLMSGFHVKDRSKFEAKLRDLRDADPDQWWRRRSPDSDVGALKEELDKALENDEITMEEYTEQLVQAREQLSDKRYGKNRDKNEVSDISELIRAAQDGDVQADYILQVNDLEINFAPSTRKINIKSFKETSSFLAENPGLRVEENDDVHALPATIPQQWMVAVFNAKLINVKTGSIDWIGEYSIDSRAVVEDGIQIHIDVRKEIENEREIEKQVAAYNDRVRKSYLGMQQAYQDLSEVSLETAKSISYFGLPEDAEKHRNKLLAKYSAGKAAYEKARTAYIQVVADADSAITHDWEIEYLVDDPHLTPDFTAREGAGSPEQLMEHFRKLGSKITTDLISSIQ
jgi:hypothetical protein